MKLKDIFHTYQNNQVHFQLPYMIAEAGVNHEGNMDIAKRLVREAKEGGADAIKFQTYKAEKIASRQSPYYWDINKEPTKSQYELFKKYDAFGEDEFRELRDYCNMQSIEFLSTPFDVDSADYLNDLMDVFKISSSDITNKPFIEYLCKFEKPIILSTGASSLEEIQDAKKWIDSYGNHLALLHCVLNYPTLDEYAHLGRITGLIKHFPDTIIGYSDHTLPKDMKILEIAALLGARILEKHFTHDKTLPGNDHYHAMDKEDLKKYFLNSRKLTTILGDYNVDYNVNEDIARKNARRSLISCRDIAENTVLSSSDLTWKRPGTGISPKEINKIIGRISKREIKEDEILDWDMFF